MISLDSVSFDTFIALQGQSFTVRTGELLLELSLHEVRKLGHKRAEALRDPFCLLFRAARGLRLAQGTYVMACDSLGEIELFITQVADGVQGSEFEAIFT